MIKGFAHAAVTVKNMEESVRFYEEVLGCHRVFDLPNPKDGSPWIVYLMMAKGQFIELFYGGETAYEWNDKLIGFSHLCFETDSVHEFAEHARKCGVKLIHEPNMGCDNNWQCWITDPNGIRIEIMQITQESPQAKANESVK